MGHQRGKGRGPEGIFEETIPTIHASPCRWWTHLKEKTHSGNRVARIAGFPVAVYFGVLTPWGFVSATCFWLMTYFTSSAAFLQSWKMQMDCLLPLHDCKLHHELLSAVLLTTLQWPWWEECSFPWTPWVTHVPTPLVNLQASQG